MHHEIAIQPEVFFGQIVYVFGGLFLLLLGTLLFYTIAHWRLHGARVEGVILGVRRRGSEIHNVYEYAMPGGGLRKATSVQGGASLKGRETGRRVAIRVMPHQPQEAREAASGTLWALASGLSGSGAWLTYVAITTWKRSPFTWILLALVAMFLGRRVWRRLSPWLTKAHSGGSAAEVWSTLPLEHAETLGLTPAPSRIQIRGIQPRRAGALICIAGLVTFAIAYIPTHRLLGLRSGTRTEGTVLKLESDTSIHGNYSVFPEVQYINSEGTTVRFLDRVGSNPSLYTAGDHVTVLYQPGKQNTGMVDHGLRNWEPVGALLLLGTVLTTLGCVTLRARSSSINQTQGVQQFQV